MSDLLKGLNEQFNFEISSAYIYMGMSAFCKSQGMDGFANFMFKQSKEELEHARKMYDFLFDVDFTPVFEQIDKPQAEYDSFLDVFKSAYEHEQEVTRRINALYNQALDERDHRVSSFLQWYIDEQVEEEDSFRSIIEKLERVKDSWNGLYLLDSQMAQR